MLVSGRVLFTIMPKCFFFVVKVISPQALRPAVSRMMEEGAVQPRFLACLFTVCGTISDVQ